MLIPSQRLQFGTGVAGPGEIERVAGAQDKAGVALPVLGRMRVLLRKVLAMSSAPLKRQSKLLKSYLGAQMGICTAKENDRGCQTMGQS